MGKIKLTTLGDEIIYVTTGADAGQGSFLDPPNYPTHKYGITSRDRSQSIESFYNENPQLRHELKEYMVWDKLPENHPEVQKWIQSVYSFFKDSYSPDGEIRDVTKSITFEPAGSKWVEIDPTKWTSKPQPPKHHLGYLLVKEFYPNHKPRSDLIKGKSKWGQIDYKKIISPTPVTVKKGKGWRLESARHSLARKGIKTKRIDK